MRIVRPASVAKRLAVPDGTPRNGMDAPRMGPSKGGMLSVSLIMITAAAPRRCPWTARSVRGQMPRWTATMSPDRAPLYA